MNALLSHGQVSLLGMSGLLPANAEAIASVVLSWIGQALVFGSLLAIVTWLLLSTALRRARPAIHAAFWLIVIAKFLLPVGPGWSYSLATLTSTVAPWLGSASAPAQAMPPAAKPGNISTLFLYFIPTVAGPSAIPSVPTAVPAPATAARLPSIPALLCGAYLAGLALVTAIRVYRFSCFARLTRNMPLAGDDVVELVEQTAARLRLRRVPTVRISDIAPAPFVIGAWRPTLVLSTDNLRRTDECEAVILHELAHLRRHDLLVRYAQWLAGTLLYFWPVVAWVNRRIDLAREAACDEWALRHGRLSPAAYARCLLKHMRPRRFALIPYAPAAMAANAAHVERRIEMILNSPNSMRRNRMTMLISAAALCGWTGFVMSGANAALPRMAAEDANKPAKSPNWAAKYGALNFFLPNVAESLDEEAEEDGVWVEAMGEPISVEGMQLSFEPQNGQPFLLSRVARSFSPAIQVEGRAFQGAPLVLALNANSSFKTNAGVDVDGNGTISPEEHDAYLTALAMRDPAAVLAKYPKADSNSDGVLSPDEASSLIQSDNPMSMAAPMVLHVQGQPGEDLQEDFRIAYAFAGSEAAAAGTPQGRAGSVITVQGMPLTDCEESAANGEMTIETRFIGADEQTITTDGKDPRAAFIVKAVEGMKLNAGDAKPRVMIFRSDDPSNSVAAKTITVTDGAASDGVRKSKTITVTNENGVIRTETTEQEGDGEPKVSVTETPATDGDVTITKTVEGVPILSQIPVLSHMFVAHAGSDGTQPAGLPTAENMVVEGRSVQLQEPAAAWLLSNAPTGEKAVTAADVRKFSATASDASLKRFLRQHPKSDTNKDGTLTVAERDAYQAKMQTRRQKKMLEQFPQADKDKNGSLTDEEIREFFKTKGGAVAGMPATAEGVVTTEGGPTMRVTKTVTNGADGNVEVRVIATPEAKDGPR